MDNVSVSVVSASSCQTCTIHRKSVNIWLLCCISYICMYIITLCIRSFCSFLFDFCIKIYVYHYNKCSRFICIIHGKRVLLPYPVVNREIIYVSFSHRCFNFFILFLTFNYIFMFSVKILFSYQCHNHGAHHYENICGYKDNILPCWPQP